MKDYVRGDLMTVGELKSLKKGDIVYLYYLDDEEDIFHGYVKLCEFSERIIFSCEGFAFPLHDLDDNELVKAIKNNGWFYSIHKVKKKTLLNILDIIIN